MRSPAVDEIEVTIFGRGVGESVVVHIGDGDWMIVDSFNGPSGPVALDYLTGTLGVGPDRVRAIVISHFDIDHYRGVHRLVDQCREAALYVTGAIDPTWYELLEITDPEDETLGDLAAAIATARARTPVEDDSWFRTVAPSSRLIETEHGEVVALAPTQNAVNHVNTSISQLLRDVDGTPQEIRRTLSKDNHSSVVLDVRMLGQHVLMGADLERSPNRFGWRAVLTRWKQTPRPASDLVKVPHHGSGTGHDEHLEGLCVAQPTLLLAPNSNHGLPLGADLQRLCTWGGQVWQAAPSEAGTAVPGTDVILGPKRIGRVTARRRPAEEVWRLEHELPGAQVECEVVADV